jgi:hypothetical protein
MAGVGGVDRCPKLHSATRAGPEPNIRRMNMARSPDAFHKYRAGIGALPLRLRAGPTTITLAVVLFSSCILSARPSAHISICVDRSIEISSAGRTTPDNPHLLDSPQVNRLGTRAGVDHPTCKTAEQSYEAASADARTLERAIFITELRHEVERALGKRLSDDELRTLADQAREEAHKWYKYIQTHSGCAASWHGEIIPWPSPTHRGRITIETSPAPLSRSRDDFGHTAIGAAHWSRLAVQ